jgi:hypothetical protein
VHYIQAETRPEGVSASRPIEATAKQCSKKRVEGKCALQEMGVQNGQLRLQLGEVARSKRCGDRISQDLQIEGINCRVVLDTGSQISLIPQQVVKQLGARKGKRYLGRRIRESRAQVGGIGSGTLRTSQEISLLVHSRSTFAKVNFLIDNRREASRGQAMPIILGTNGLAALGYSLLSPEGKQLITPSSHVAAVLEEWNRSQKGDRESGVGMCRVGARMPTGGMSESLIEASDPSHFD